VIVHAPILVKYARMEQEHRVSQPAEGDVFVVRRLSSVTEFQIAELCDVLVDCVEGGASVSFMSPLSPDRASAFWTAVAAKVRDGQRALLVAEVCGAIVGTVQLILQQEENQAHRADVSKMLVHRRVRRRGVGEALLVAAEAVARECGKSLLVLDTASGDAERLYARVGWQRVGVIPGFARLPDGPLCDTTVFYRDLGAPKPASSRVSR
jgi:GNAT superfamily N-acetyltransferase